MITYRTVSWHLSPAYDLTYSTTYFGERSTTVNGKGADIQLADLLEVARAADLKRSWAEDVAFDIVQKTAEGLGDILDGEA